MFRATRDTPAFYLTSVTKNRLPVFRTKVIADLVCSAINEARSSGRFLIFAYVIMLDHLHLVTDSSRKSAEIHRYVNGIVSRRVIDYLKAGNHQRSLEKLRVDRRDAEWQYSLWDHHPDTRLLWSEQMLWQRIQYTHLNPVRAGVVGHPNEWRWSSARIFHGRAADDEPLAVDLNKVVLNSSAR
ncbi:MAG: transposase [Pyrinomonadaceae bacterium]